MDGLNQNRVHARTAAATSVSSPCDRRRGEGFVKQLDAIGRVHVPGLRVERPVRVVNPDRAKRRSIVSATFALRLVTSQGVLASIAWSR